MLEKKVSKTPFPINKKYPNFLLVGPRKKFMELLASHKHRLQQLFWNLSPVTSVQFYSRSKTKTALTFCWSVAKKRFWYRWLAMIFFSKKSIFNSFSKRTNFQKKETEQNHDSVNSDNHFRKGSCNSNRASVRREDRRRQRGDSGGGKA